MGGWVDGDGAGRLRAMARRGGSGDGPSMAAAGRASCSCSTTAPAATAAARQCKAPKLEGVYGGRCRSWRARAASEFVTADDRYIRDSILLPKSQVVAGYEPVMPSFKGGSTRKTCCRSWHTSSRSAGRGGAMSVDHDAEPTARRRLPQRQLHAQVVAPDDGPQADRPAVHGLDHALLLRRRGRGDGDAARS